MKNKKLLAKDVAASTGNDPLIKVFLSPVPKGKGKSVAEHLERLAPGLSKLKLRKVNTIQLTAGSDEDAARWHVVLGPESRVVEGAHKRPNLEIIASEAVLLQILSGAISPLEAFAGGTLRVRGDIRLANLAAQALQR